jgi:outer membrane protein
MIMRCLLICFGLFLQHSSDGQTHIYKSIDEALERGRKENATVKMAYLQQEIASKDRAIGWAALMPSMALNLNSDYNLKLPVQLIPAEIFGGPAGTFKQVRFGLNWNQSAAFEFNLPIVHPEKLAGAKVASITTEQVKLEQQAAIHQVLQKITSQYFQVLQLEGNLKLSRMLDSTAEILYQSTLARYEQQIASRVDLNRAENLMHANKQQSLTHASGLMLAKQNMALLLNIADPNQLKIDDHLLKYFDLPLPETTTKAGSRPAYLASDQAEMAMRWRMRQHLYTGLPRLSFNSRYSFSRQSNELFDPLATNFEFGTIGLQLNIPLFKGRNNYLLYRKARLQLDQASIRKSQILLESDAELNEWNTRLKEKLESRKMAARRDQLALQNLDLSLQLYEEGVISLDQLFNIYNEYAQARNAFLLACTEAAIYHTYFRIESLRP